MKPIKFIPLLFILLTTQIFGQDFFVKLSSGLGIGTSTREYNSLEVNQYSDGSYNTNQKSKSFSFGEGYYFSGTFGYFFNDNIGADLELQYSRSPDVGYITRYNYYDQHNLYFNNHTYKSHAYFAIPSLIVCTQIDQFKPYLKIGAVVGIASISYNYQISTNNSIPEQNYFESTWIERTYTYDGGIALGTNMALGIKYSLTDKLGLDFQVSSRNLSYAPTKGTLEEAWTEKGSEKDNLPNYVQQIRFVDNANYNSNTYDRNKPSEQPKVYYPFSALVVSLGITMNI